MKKNPSTEPIADILSRVLREQKLTTSQPEQPEATPEGKPSPQTSTDTRYDFDLAEFPLFRLNKLAATQSGREPIRYSDSILGRDQQPITRTWTVYAGPFGFGGQSTQLLLFELLQLYIEQGACGTQIQFGTLRSLFLRRGERNPSKRDYDRMRRDFDILRGYDIHCQNAFWDSRKQSYISMNWRLFESVFYFRTAHNADDDEQPFGFIEVSSVLRSIAKNRGFFNLGFDRHRFYSLRPLEQRLAVYLAKQFTSQKLHRRFVNDLAKVLPIEAGRDRDVRRLLAEAANGLIAKKLPTLASFRLAQSSSQRWLAEFSRGTKTPDTYSIPRPAAVALTPAVSELVSHIAKAVGSDDDRIWWARCVERLGAGAVDRALGILKESRQSQQIKNPGGFLTSLFQKIATEYGVALN